MFTVNIILSNTDSVIYGTLDTLSEVKENFNFLKKYSQLHSYKVFNEYGMYLFDLADLPDCKISGTEEWEKLITSVRAKAFSEDLMAQCKDLKVGETITISCLEIKRTK